MTLPDSFNAPLGKLRNSAPGLPSLNAQFPCRTILYYGRLVAGPRHSLYACWRA